MERKAVKVSVWVSLVVLAIGSWAAGQTCEDRIAAGRVELFSGTLSGLREAAAIFEEAAGDPVCAGNREAVFFEAITRMILLGVRDDGGVVDSAWELTREFGFEPMGDSFYPFDLDVSFPMDEYGNYVMPGDTPTVEEVGTWTADSTIPEIDAILGLLESLSTGPGDPLQVHFTPAETGLEEDLEVDDGDVLVIQGALHVARGLLEAEVAYDLWRDPNDGLDRRVREEVFQVNEDLLWAYPDFLKLNASVDAGAILAQARADVITGIDYYFDAIEAIRGETDDQLNDLLYVDPRATDRLEEVDAYLQSLRGSLTDDTGMTVETETAVLYGLEDVGGADRGDLSLLFGPMDLSDGGEFCFVAANGLRSRWDVGEVAMEDGRLYAEADYVESELLYTGYASLSNAPSLLFTPVSDSLYQVSTVPAGLFDPLAGTAQGWQGVDEMWAYTLPFVFPFYGQSHDVVYVGSNGQIGFDASTAASYDGPWYLESQRLIAPFWDRSLETSVPGDIYISQPEPGAVTIRWYAIYSSSYAYEFSATLFSDGRIRFDYGNHSSMYLWRTVGISNGQTESSIVVGYDWGSGLLTGLMAADGSRIDRMAFERWGMVERMEEGLVAERVSSEIQTIAFDPNPVFGGTGRYPDPVVPRDLLPLFDEWNGPLPGTVGQGLQDQGATLDEAATLGGIFPEMTQEEWVRRANLQPGGRIALEEAIPLQREWTYDGYFVDFWFEEQCVFSDPAGDTDVDEDASVEGGDIESLYLAGDNSYLYGTVYLYGPADVGEGRYELVWSPDPEEGKAPGSVRFWLGTYGDSCDIEAQQYIRDEWGWEYWDWLDVDWTGGRVEGNRIDFFVSWMGLPSLAGRFVSLDSRVYDDEWRNAGKENNPTHLQVAYWGEQSLMGSIAGSVACASGCDETIVVRAYSDPEDPSDSTIASAMLAGPGAFALADIPLGWSGYVSASALAGAYNPFAVKTEEVEQAVAVFMDREEISGIDLVLSAGNDYCLFAEPIAVDELVTGSTVGASGDDISSCGCGDDLDVWYRFTPGQARVYAFELVGLDDFSGRLSLFDGCGGDEILCHRPCTGPEAYLNVQGGQSVLLRVAGIEETEGSFTLSVTEYGPAVVNDFCMDALPLTVGVPLAGTTVGATGEDLTQSVYHDDRDVWFTFTASADAVYSFAVSTTCAEYSLGVRTGCDDEGHWYRVAGNNELYFNARAGETNYVRFAGAYGEVGDYTITVEEYGPAMAYDYCDAPGMLAVGAPVSGTTEFAGADHPPCGEYDYLDVWYEFIAPQAGVYEVQYPYDFTVGLYGGCDEYEAVACLPAYDDGVGYFRAEAGEVFLVRVARDGYPGPYTLSVGYAGESPLHDERAGAVELTVNVPWSGSSANATGGDISSCACGDDRDVWHRIEIPATGVYTVELTGVDFDARFAVFTEAWPAWLGELDELTCYRPCDPSTASFYAREGQTCYVRVAGTGSAVGNYTIVCRTTLLGDTNLDGGVDLLDLLVLQSQWLNSGCSSVDWCDQADIDRSGEVDLRDFAWLGAMFGRP